MFTMVLLAASNLDADSIPPPGRPLRSRFWPTDWRLTIQMDEGDQGLSTEPSFATYI